MIKNKNFFESAYAIFLSEETKEKSEKAIVILAIVAFLLHLAIILLSDSGIIDAHDKSRLLHNPISAIYTPFSFILIYEVYLLVYYLPKSITIYVGKQYEIITLIIIRRAFKDLANLELSSDWFAIKYDLQFTYDLGATLILFFLIFLFYKLARKKNTGHKIADRPTEELNRFIRQKRVIAAVLVPTFVVLAFYSLGNWLYEYLFSIREMVDHIHDVNRIFFDEFFTILILTDVLLLLISFTHTNQFYKVIRNSGFIISTILLRLSFTVDGLLNTVLILAAVVFGVLILLIHNQYAKFEGTWEETS